MCDFVQLAALERADMHGRFDRNGTQLNHRRVQVGGRLLRANELQDDQLCTFIAIDSNCSNCGEHEGGTALAPQIRPADVAELVGGLEKDRHEGHELESCAGTTVREYVQVSRSQHNIVSE